MRDKKEIHDSLEKFNYAESDDDEYKDSLQRLQLEVLLDIRQLLMEADQ